MLLTEAWVICGCRRKHELYPGVGSPYYWCGDELKVLVVGDEVEYKGMNSLNGISEEIKKRSKILGIPLRHWEFFFKIGRFPR